MITRIKTNESKYEALRNEIIILETENNVLRSYIGLEPKKPKLMAGNCIKVDFTQKRKINNEKK